MGEIKHVCYFFSSLLLYNAQPLASIECSAIYAQENAPLQNIKRFLSSGTPQNTHHIALLFRSFRKHNNKVFSELKVWVRALHVSGFISHLYFFIPSVRFHWGQNSTMKFLLASACFHREVD